MQHLLFPLPEGEGDFFELANKNRVRVVDYTQPFI